jgi:putative heme-binding domain-containing protein
LIDLLSVLPAEETHPLLRGQWPDFSMRDAIILRLAEKPEVIDRDKFLFGLDSSDEPVVRGCLSALAQLPRDRSPKNQVPILRLLRRLEQEARAVQLRKQALLLYARQSGKTIMSAEAATDAVSLKRLYEPLILSFERDNPALVRALEDSADENPAAWDKLLRSVVWQEGDARRGEVLFRTRACQTCHAGSRALGPDLTGVANRFSRDDLFTAIIYPSRDVAPAYRTWVIETRSGQLVTGMIAFESADGLIVQTGATTTVRIATADIASRLPSNRSLMPNGLLKDLKAGDLADLYSYLQTLKPATTPGKAKR